MSTFKETGLNQEILKAIGEMGFETPTPIQKKTIPALLSSGQDIIALAQTGTGKTAAFGLPLIQLTEADSASIQALVLCPTRELCMQITGDLKEFSKYMRQIKIEAVYGGTSIDKQIKAIKAKPQVVVGTPGRVLDLIRRKVLNLTQIQWLVFDEADEMLNMGFKEDLDAILEKTPDEKQTCLFSATMPREIVEIAEKYMRNPEEISVGKRNSGADNVKHEYYVVHARDRFEALKRLADVNPKLYGIVFCRTRQDTKEVADKLIDAGYNADALHGDLSQQQRDYVMNRFRSKNLQILVATDVAARGLDVNDLTHVINYNLPDELEAYTHRSGRTGRAGKNGISIALVHARENRKIKDLEKVTGIKFERKMVPTGKEICEKQLFNLVSKVEKVNVEDAKIEEFLPAIYKKLEWLSREELIKHFVSVEFNQFLNYYKDADDLNIPVSTKNGKESRGRDRNKSFTRFYINLGEKNRLNPARLMGILNENTQNRSLEIGKIDIMKKFSFFEVDKKFEGDVLQAFKNADFEGIPLVVEISIPESESRKDKDNSNYFRENRKKNKGQKKRRRF